MHAASAVRLVGRLAAGSDTAEHTAALVSTSSIGTSFMPDGNPDPSLLGLGSVSIWRQQQPDELPQRSHPGRRASGRTYTRTRARAHE